MTVRLAHLHPDIAGTHRYYPGLAEAWAMDSDGQRVYVRLDPDARWSDGNPVTSDDMRFMFYFFQSPHIQDPWYNNWYGKDVNYTDLTVYDERTFSIGLVDARPNMAALVLELYPKPREFHRDFGPDFVERYQWRFTPTTGPFVLTDDELEGIRTDRTGVSLERLEDWWADSKRNWRYRYNPDRIQLTVIRDTPKAFEAALAGELDFIGGMGLAEYWYDQLPDDHPLVERGLIHKTTFYNDVPRPTYGLYINAAQPILGDRDVRLGIHYASNWQLVLDQYFRGDYVRMNTTADGYGDMTHPDIRARAFDLAKAAEHFDEAGFTQRGPDGILVNEQGQRLSFTLTTGYESLAPVLNILRQEALKAGLELQVEILDSATAWKKVQEKNHDIAFTAFGVGVELYPRYWEFYHSANAYDVPYLEDGSTPNPDRSPNPQTNNFLSTAIPELDALIDAYDTSDDLDEMREMAYRMEEILYADGSFVPGFVTPFYRTAYWRWMRFPEGFDVRFSGAPTEYNLYWIDESARTETMEARRGDGTFPRSVTSYDQWRTTP
jgi:microcin C transport system substrate-binding protein